MPRFTIRPAGPEDIGALDFALRSLSADLGDTHKATVADLAAAAFAEHPSFRALLAENGNETVGATVFSPLFSTRMGSPGVYVSDLWVGPAARGSGLGRRLLAAAMAEGNALWGARFIKLAVHHDNEDAQAFYERLDFIEIAGEHSLILSGAALTALEGGCDEGLS